MKNFLISTLLSVSTIAGCGTADKSETEAVADKCVSPAVGTWHGTKDTVTILGDETFAYTGDDGCKSSGQFICNTLDKGWIAVTIKTATASAYCNQAGTYQCGYRVTGNQLEFFCMDVLGRVSALRTYTK